MDKFRRTRKPSSPQQILPATSSSAGVPSSASSTKFTIQQKVTPGAVKKGPNSLKRSVDPNDILIKRRPGEGSKPLFSREDICVNRSVSPKKKPISRTSSSDSSSPEHHSRRRRNSSKSKQAVVRKKTPEKIPYFADQTREKDRIKRVYGQRRRSRSLSQERNRRPIGNLHSRSRTPPLHRRRRSYERRSHSRDRYRQRHCSDYSRSRSRSRERRRTFLSRRSESFSSRQSLAHPPVTQYIPIPVPVEYPFMQPAWGGPMMPPQPRFPFPMRPVLPPPMSYMPRNFRPPRYGQNAYQRGHFRPRQY